VFGWYINLTGSVLLAGATALSPLLARDSANERRGTSLCPPLVLLLAGATALSPLLARDSANERRGTSLCPPRVRLLTGEKRHPPADAGPCG